jgi:leader peptidase (prepilin peptidase)/N-methyltransferase
MIRVLGTVFAALLGLAFGSFLNVCLSRWPQDESVATPRSHCRSCGRTLPWWESVPLLSWLALRGRCHSCKAWIGWRYPLVELTVGVLWAVVAWRSLSDAFMSDASSATLYRSLAACIGQMIFYWLLAALAFLDAENLWLPNRLTLPGAGLGFSFAVLVAVFGSRSPVNDTVEPMRAAIARAAIGSLIGMAACGGLILLIRWIFWLVRKQEGIGLGDAKLMAMLGAWLGLPGAMLALFVGVMLGSVAALALLALPRMRGRSDDGSWAMIKLPLGTFFSIGGVVSGLWGERILTAYLRLAGWN